eukprot:scaffold53231_cov30-Tisochrysis_lutea.AAC.6
MSWENGSCAGAEMSDGVAHPGVAAVGAGATLAVAALAGGVLGDPTESSDAVMVSNCMPKT